LARSRARKAQAATPFGLIQLDRGLSIVQLGLLLTAVIVIPLVVLPESNFVDITSTPKSSILRILGVLQLGVLLARLVLVLANENDGRLRDSLNSIRFAKSAAAILGSVAAVGIISVISASFAILPHQSWWGRVPAGFEAGEFSALMYIVFAISAFVTVRESSGGFTLWRTVAVTGVLATFVGFFQYLGLSPLDISSTHSIRITGTNGNPIFFGAMLVLLIPITFGVIFAEYQESTNEYKRWWLAAIAVVSFVTAISLISVVSRGPWVGVAVSGIIGIALLVKYHRFRANQLPLAALLTFAIAGALVATFVDPTPPEQSDDSASVANTNSTVINSALSGVGRTSTMDLRLRYWRLSGNMSLDRGPVPYTNDAPKIFRWLFGYGPDMFRFAGTYFSDTTTFTRRLTAAHNDPINRLVEQGFLGFLAWVSLWGSIAFGAVALIRRVGRGHSNTMWWISVGIVAALAGRFVEQLFGSPTPGGTLIFWVLVGGLAGLLVRPGSSIAARSVLISRPRVPQLAVYASLVVILIGSAIR